MFSGRVGAAEGLSIVVSEREYTIERLLMNLFALIWLFRKREKI